MAWPFLEGAVKIVVEITIGGKVTVNVHFVTKKLGAPVDAGDLVPLANAVYDAYDVGWQAAASDEVEITQISATNWEATAGRIGFTTETLPLVGSVAEDELPANVAAVVTNRSNFTGRSKRGRTYYTGLHEGGVDGNNMDVSVQNLLLLTSEGIGTNVDLEDYVHVVYSLYEDGSPRTTPLATGISEYEINARVDTQRRRLPN